MDTLTLPEEHTIYMISNLRVDAQVELIWHVSTPPASPVEVATLYVRRPRIEQAYREVKQHLGWTHCQARSDVALRRHRSLVCTAFCFLLWIEAHHSKEEHEGANQPWSTTLHAVRGRLEPFTWVWRCWRAFSDGDPPRRVIALLDRVTRGLPLFLYAT